MNYQYCTIDDAWKDLLFDLNDAPKLDSRVGKCKERLGYTLTLANLDNTFLLNARRKLSPWYACAEFLWYLTNTRDISMIKAYAPQYVNYAEDNNAYGAYGYRLRHNTSEDQLSLLVRHLTQDKNSRQAVVTIWNADDLAHACLKDHKDLPCTLSWQFLLRNDKLHMVVTMRSQDAWLGFPYDVFAFTCVQRVVAHALGVECGTYKHQVGSEHLYEKNWKAAEEARELKFSAQQRYLFHGWDINKTAQWQCAMTQACSIEQVYRTQQLREIDINHAENMMISELNEFMQSKNNVLRDAALVCANKWNDKVFDEISSPILKEAIKNAKRKERVPF